MNMITNQAEGRVPVTILAVQGDIDGSNYQDLIAKAKELYLSGTRHLLMDVSQVSFMSSSGLVALHSIALLLQGMEPPSPENGWAVFRSVAKGPGPGPSPFVKLLNAQPKVDRVLKTSGLKAYFDSYDDLTAAIASF